MDWKLAYYIVLATGGLFLASCVAAGVEETWKQRKQERDLRQEKELEDLRAMREASRIPPPRVDID